MKPLSALEPCMVCGVLVRTSSTPKSVYGVVTAPGYGGMCTSCRRRTARQAVKAEDQALGLPLMHPAKPSVARPVHHETPEADKAWVAAYVADRRRRGVNPDGVFMEGDPVNGRGGRKPKPAPAKTLRVLPSHCPHGHEYTPENTSINSQGHVRCRACARASSRASKARAGQPRAPRPVITHCPHGHEYTPENSYISPNGCRLCRTCRREASKRQELRRPARTRTAS